MPITMAKRTPRQATKTKTKAKTTRKASAPLRTKSEDVKRAPRASKARTASRARRAKPEDAPFNPISAVMNAQIRLATAMVRWSPVGFFLGGTPEEPRGKRR